MVSNVPVNTDAISFVNRDWQILKAWLLQEQEKKIGMLISCTENDKSNQIRGSISMIRQVLALEHAAQSRAALLEEYN